MKRLWTKIPKTPQTRDAQEAAEWATMMNVDGRLLGKAWVYHDNLLVPYHLRVSLSGEGNLLPDKKCHRPM